MRPLHVQLADLLVKPGNEGFIGFLAFLVLPVENAGRYFSSKAFPQASVWLTWTSYRAANWATVAPPLAILPGLPWP